MAVEDILLPDFKAGIELSTLIENEPILGHRITPSYTVGSLQFPSSYLSPRGLPFRSASCLSVIQTEPVKDIDSHVQSHKILSAPTGTMSTSNCSEGPNRQSHLFTKPLVSRFIRESRMPCHEVRRGLDLKRSFHDAYTGRARNNLRQFARHCEN